MCSSGRLEMDPEDGGYATTDEELDSESEEFDLEQDLKLWLSQLDSSTNTTNTMKQPSVKKNKTSDRTTNNNMLPGSNLKPEIDFDSILGELNCLDDQFDEQLNFSSPSGSQSIPTNCTSSGKATSAAGKPVQPSRSTVSDDFGEIGSQLQNALSELNKIGKIVDDNSGLNSANSIDPVKQRTGALGGGGKQQHHETIGRVENCHPQPERTIMESGGKNFRTGETLEGNSASLHQSLHSGNKLIKNDGGGGGGGGWREDSLSLTSSDSRSSTNSLSHSNKDFRMSRQSIMTENSAQVCLKVYAADSSSKSVMVDSSTTVGHLCDILVEKNHVDGNLSWSVCEQIPEMLMQRLLEDHRFVLEEIQGWTKQSSNCLTFIETPKKYDMFDKSRILDENCWEPETIDGWLHLKSDGKKVWKKLNFVVKNGGIYYNSRGKGKSDMACLIALQNVEIYTGVGWKKKFKAPTEFGIALKPVLVQKKTPESVKYLCADDHGTMWKWVSALRLAKHGYQLYRNFCRSAQLSDNIAVSSRDRSIADSDRSINDKSNGHHRVSEIVDEVTAMPAERLYDCPVNTLRRGSSEIVRGNADYAGSSKMKAQLPMTAQTARLLSMQQPGSIKALPSQTTNRGESFKQPQVPEQQQRQKLWQQPQQWNTNSLPAFAAEKETMQHSSGFEDSDVYRSPSPDLPPPPPELLMPCTDGPVSPPCSSKKSGPPTPPRRDQSTKLSFHGHDENVQTKNFILNLQRAIGQKQQHGAGGLTQLEMPLPPPPVYSDYPSYIDLGQLPPPPAELLLELKVMKRKSRPPPPTLAKQSTLRSSKFK